MQEGVLKVLHTSDWHLGKTLLGRKRHDEFERFLNWLVDLLKREAVDVLLIAGDIFDTTVPDHRAQELYYQFLWRAGQSGCRHVVIIGGNHDSPSFLEAPKSLLKAINVHIVGAAKENAEDEIFFLADKQSQLEAVICAVPYLRDRDIRLVSEGETPDDKQRQLVLGIQNHYQLIADQALNDLNQRQERVPIIGMGHLFTRGGKTSEGDGVRDLYVGTLAHVGSESFPACFDYIALGHLHVPQTVPGGSWIRYAGSPLAMSFGEAGQQKEVVLVTFPKPWSSEHNPEIETIPVPVFQELRRVKGTLDSVLKEINCLVQNNSHSWLEIELTGKNMESGIKETIGEAVSGSKLEILRIRKSWKTNIDATLLEEEPLLEELAPSDVFERCLDFYDILEEERDALKSSFFQVIQSIQEEDTNAGS